MSKGKPTVAQLLYAATAVFQARLIVEKHKALPEGDLDSKLRELEVGYYRQAEAMAKARK